MKAWDTWGSNDHAHHCSKDQTDSYKHLYILKRNTDEGTREGKHSHHPEFYSAVQEGSRVAASESCASSSFTDSQQQQNRSSSMALALRLPLLNRREEMPGETRLDKRGGATTVSGIVGHVGAKTIGSRHSRKVTLFLCQVSIGGSATKDGNFQ